MSKFKGVLDAANKREPAPTLVEVLAGKSRGPDLAPAPTPASTGRKRGGKRSDPDYEQITAYVRKDTYRRVKIELLNDGRGKESSELIEELLSQWINGRQS